MVDKYDKGYEIGDMINFTMDRDVRFIKPGEKVIKIVAGKGGTKSRLQKHTLKMATVFSGLTEDVLLKNTILNRKF